MHQPDIFLMVLYISQFISLTHRKPPAKSHQFGGNAFLLVKIKNICLLD